MSSRIIPVEPFTLAVFGATGDLARRKLLPSLWRRLQAGQAPANSRLIGIARKPLSDEAFRQLVADAVIAADINAANNPQLQQWLQSARYFSLDAATTDGWERLADTLRQSPRPQLFYLAVSPTLAAPLCEHLRKSACLGDDGRLILEKPFGRDLASARALNATVRQTASENNVYRIDHYLGKETVQNLMALRFANALFEPMWNSRAIDHVQITVAEDIGVGDRGGYYDHAGAARDMLQNHLLQLLCLLAMEAPARYDADSVRDEKLKVLRCLQPLDAADMASSLVAGQYVGSRGEKSYITDIGGKPSNTETFIAVKCAIDNWRWSGAPFYLRTGKRLAARMSEIAVFFTQPPHSVFPTLSPLSRNSLVLRLQPSEGITLHLNIKDPGPGGFRLSEVPLDMSFADSLGVVLPDAYERLMMDVVRGDQTLFMRNDELEAAWRWVDPIVHHLQESKPHPYLCGSSGPDDSLRLLHADGRRWRNIT